MMRAWFAVCGLLLMLSLPAFAQEDVLVYSRGIITIVPAPGSETKQLPSTPEPQNETKAEEQPEKSPAKPASAPGAVKDQASASTPLNDTGKAKPQEIVRPPTPPVSVPRTPQRFAVAIRSQAGWREKDFHLKPLLNGRNGILVVYGKSDAPVIARANVLGALDALMIARDGTIVQIAPSLTLSELEGDLKAGFPLRAVLYLQAGSVEQFDIRPKDRVESPLFEKPPLILQ